MSGFPEANKASNHHLEEVLTTQSPCIYIYHIKT